MIDDGILLIVDDAASNRLLLKAIFKNEYKIEEAENGQQALEVLERSEGRVLAILLDLVMPVMDGYQFLDHFKKIPDSSKIPVIVITGDMSIESQNRGFTLGIADYIAKPFATSVVKHRVRNLVDLFEHQNNLEYLVEKQSSKIREQSSKLISALSTLVEFRDLESGQHINRIKFFTRALMSEVSRAHPEYGFTPIPTLVEFLDFMRGNELVINIELKTGRFRYPGLEEKTVRLVREFGMAERVWYSSFNHESVLRVKEIARGSHFAFLLAQVFLDMPAYALRHGIEALHPDSAILGLCPDLLAQAHTAGQRVHVWTVDSRLEMKEMCRLGVDAFVTDCPDNGRRIVDEYFSEQTDLGSRE